MTFTYTIPFSRVNFKENDIKNTDNSLNKNNLYQRRNYTIEHGNTEYKDKEQNDETDLMPYQVLVEIEQWAIQHKYPPSEIYKTMKSKYGSDIKIWIKKFFRLWTVNQWKRERIAPSFHLDAFNIDPRTWCRFPILSSGFKEELDALDEI